MQELVNKCQTKNMAGTTKLKINIYIYLSLCEERDIFGSNSRQTGSSTQTDHKTEVRSNISPILSLPPQLISLLSNLMVLTAL